MAWTVVSIFMYPNEPGTHLPPDITCQIFVQENILHARLLLLEEPQAHKSLVSDFNSYERSLLPRISKTSHAGPMSTLYSPRSAVTVMAVGKLTFHSSL
jgi:hypothetical protein